MFQLFASDSHDMAGLFDPTIDRIATGVTRQLDQLTKNHDRRIVVSLPLSVEAQIQPFRFLLILNQNRQEICHSFRRAWQVRVRPISDAPHSRRPPA